MMFDYVFRKLVQLKLGILKSQQEFLEFISLIKSRSCKICFTSKITNDLFVGQ